MTASAEAVGMQIRLNHLRKSFGATDVLQNITLDILPGEFVAIVGKSGSGKSTILRLLAGLDVPSAGSLLIDDVPLTGRNHGARVIFQDARLLPWKRVLANVTLGLPPAAEHDANAALAEVGLAARASVWPAVLSGGERQRVALARALLHRPTLLLLDEPLGALDALTRLEMQRLIERLWQEHAYTAVLVTHDIEEAVALADRVVVLSEGRIALNLVNTLPRPRDRQSVAFGVLKEQLLAEVMGASVV